MTNLLDIIAYIVDKYPYKEELSKARLTKMVYLVDWLSTMNTGHQMTAIKWYFDNYGPFVWDVIDEVKENSDIFSLWSEPNFFGEEKTLVKLHNNCHYKPVIADSEREIIDEVVSSTKKMNWTEFIRYVYSTPPIKQSKKYSNLELQNFLTTGNQQKKEKCLFSFS